MSPRICKPPLTPDPPLVALVVWNLSQHVLHPGSSVNVGSLAGAYERIYDCGTIRRCVTSPDHLSDGIRILLIVSDKCISPHWCQRLPVLILFLVHLYTSRYRIPCFSLQHLESWLRGNIVL